MSARTGAGAASPRRLPAFTQLIDQLGIHLDPELFELALVHRSFAYENGAIPNNERLEFLGDAVLGVIVAERLYRHFPGEPEGSLAKFRAAVVSSESLGQVARNLQIGPLIKLGRGEVSTGGSDKTSILADTLEALIGAIYLSDGKEPTETFVRTIFDPLIEDASHLGAALDWKTSLQEVASGLGLACPRYEISESGPDHDKRFEAMVVVGQRQFGPGSGHSKKAAEQQAAAVGFDVLSAELAQLTAVADAET